MRAILRFSFLCGVLAFLAGCGAARDPQIEAIFGGSENYTIVESFDRVELCALNIDWKASEGSRTGLVYLEGKSYPIAKTEARKITARLFSPLSYTRQWLSTDSHADYHVRMRFFRGEASVVLDLSFYSDALKVWRDGRAQSIENIAPAGEELFARLTPLMPDDHHMNLLVAKRAEWKARNEWAAKAKP